MDSARPAADAKDIRLKAIFDQVQATVNADAARLQQVIWNLLTNAIKFTPKGGQVQVLLQRVNSHLELSVSDTGIGIPASFLPHVFDRFSQRDGSTTRVFGGLGLGLAISKQLVELHGGQDPGDQPRRRPGCDVLRRAAAFDRAAGGRRLASASIRRRRRRRRTAVVAAARRHSRLRRRRRAGCARGPASGYSTDHGAQVTSFALRGRGARGAEDNEADRPRSATSACREMDGYQLMRTLRAGESRASVGFLLWR